MNKEKLLQDFQEALGTLEAAQESYSEVYEGTLFNPNDLSDIKDMIGSLSQDSEDTDYAEIDEALAKGLTHIGDLIQEDLSQADPKAPALSDTPRSPESDGATGTGIEDPYVHEFMEMLAKWVAKVKEPGTAVPTPKKDPGPQKIESGDNPDSYKSQAVDPDMENLKKELTQANELTRALNVESMRRLTQDSIKEYVGAIRDPYAASIARAMLQGLEDLNTFDAKVEEFENNIAPNLPGGAWAHAKKGVGFLGQAKDAPVGPDGRAPQNNHELVDYLIQDTGQWLESRSGTNTLNMVIGKGSGATDDIRSLQQDMTTGMSLPEGRGISFNQVGSVQTPEQNLRNLLQNLINLYPHEAEIYRAYLNQDLGTGGTGYSTIPTGQVFVFPMISRVYPQLLLSRLGAVYPIDKPDTRIFYWQHKGYKSTAGTIASTGCLLYQIGCYPMTMTADPGEADEASRLQLEMVEETLSVSSRKFAAEWSRELTTRMMAYTNRNPLNEHLTQMADQIARELNWKALDLMITASDDRVVTYGKTKPSSYDQDDWNDQLHAFVQRASDKIFESRFREAAFIVGDSTSVTRLMRGMKSGAFQKTNDTWQFADGIQVVGSVNNYFTVIKTAWMGREYPGTTTGKFKDKLLLVGRGETFSDAGIVYAPFSYEVEQPLTYPTTFKTQVGIMEQSAMRVIIPEMFARVNISATTGVDF